ncbi:Asp-tRNA(Asn)/Glu-tRNA(Gln) amidotransferase subunit GatA [Flavobacteriales bacterium]|nr:Asp-tRNA(Asn)/Glu-tRNA(Gln) amidotransferase subunit GatA [Flavobacteriales bacterium]MDA8945672.1 Asp-tRNA(Asn)/Glu-tRNA(Gln) amidotransferase subunit GatA [Flavobacteriales bacterium]
MKNFSSLSEIQASLSEGSVSCKSLVSYYLDRIENHKDLNIYLEVFSEEAQTQAQKVDLKLQQGTAGRLAGMVIALKDNICYKGHRVSASSKILEGFESLYSATVVERLLAEDAIIIGRLNCDEFAMGSSNENSAYGPVKNPHNSSKVAGGSSGGSAAAVAADLCQVALGSDTGGSIRQPAAFCGVVGLKPTYARVSRFGLIAYASSFDQIGPLTKSIEDAAIVTEIIAGKDENDSTSSSVSVSNFSNLEGSVEKKHIAYFKEYIDTPGLDPEIKENFLQLIESLRAEGHTVEEQSFSHLDVIIPTYYILTTAEASSNLARFDGVHFGYRSPNAHDLESTYKMSRTEGFGEEVKLRIMLGTFVLSSGYYDAYYTKAQKVRRLIQERTKAVFEQFEFILMPTTPNTAFDIGLKNEDPTIAYLEDIYTVHANLAGVPAISLPLWKSKKNMPIGIQLMAPAFKEQDLLTFSQYLMKFKN